MIDRLVKAIEEKNNPSVIGLDPVFEMMPEEFIKKHKVLNPDTVADIYLEFNKNIIDAIYDIVPAVKPQIAMYETLGHFGIKAYEETVKYAKEKGLIVIGDVKRGDISSTAKAYASHINGIKIGNKIFDPWGVDAVTLAPYMGSDSIKPFLEACEKKDKGVFVLLKTSNESSSEIQDLIIDGEPLYMKVADLISDLGKDLIGESGFSKVGAVVGATKKEDGERLRKRLKNTFFLVPGYGAQGGTADDIAGFLTEDKKGIIVNSSRGVIFAYKKSGNSDFAAEARKAAIAMKKDLEKIG